MGSPTSGLIDLVFLLFKGFFRKVFEKGRYIILDNVPTVGLMPLGLPEVIQEELR